ncbi:MAG: hypothetical protein ABI459_00405 [Deltaproteobacteria bacterium]
MSGIGVSDLARQLSLGNAATRIKSDTNRLTLELASGKTVQQGALSSRDMSTITALNRSLRLLNSLKSTIGETGIFLNTQQNVMDNMQTQADTAAAGFLTAGSARHPAQLSALSNDAHNRFESIVAALNSRAGDKSVFSGSATDKPALIAGADILTALKTEIAGETSSTGIVDKITDWFMAPGGGFETLAYQGNAAPAGPFPLGLGETTTPDSTAASDPIRKTLMGFAIAAMIGQAPLADTTDTNAELATAAAETLFSNGSALTDMRASIGIQQARVDESTVRTASESLTTEQALSTLTSADPYRVATELQDAISRMETLNTLTARIARLSLTEFL